MAGALNTSMPKGIEYALTHPEESRARRRNRPERTPEDTRMPKGITRGYATQFLDALNRVPGHKDLILTTKDLDAMDEIPVSKPSNPVKSDDEATAA